MATIDDDLAYFEFSSFQKQKSLKYTTDDFKIPTKKKTLRCHIFVFFFYVQKWCYSENRIFFIEGICKHKQVVCMMRKMLSSARYANV